MNEFLINAAVFLADGFLLFWLWRRIFRGSGKTILLIAWMFLSLLSIFCFEASKLLFWAALITVVVLEGWRYLKLPRYSRAVAAFETNQVLRGLSPAEAAYFIGLEEGDVFVIAILNLLDKGMLRINDSGFGLDVSLVADYFPADSSISPEDRKSFRARAAREKMQIIHPYEDVLLELIASNDGGNLTDINFEIWYQYLNNQLGKLINVYDFSETTDYAKKIVEKMTTSDSGFSSGKRNLSAWKAISLFDGSGIRLNDHRPEWLAPDDDFKAVVFELRNQAKVRL